MWEDPIVEETRKAGEKLVKAAGNDLHKFFERLREAQRKHEGKLVHRKPRLIQKSHKADRE